MQEKLRDYILACVGKNDPNLEHVLTNFNPISYRRHKLILREWYIAHYWFFVVKGGILVFLYDKVDLLPFTGHYGKGKQLGTKEFTTDVLQTPYFHYGPAASAVRLDGPHGRPRRFAVQTSTDQTASHEDLYTRSPYLNRPFSSNKCRAADADNECYLMNWLFYYQ